MISSLHAVPQVWGLGLRVQGSGSRIRVKGLRVKPYEGLGYYIRVIYRDSGKWKLLFRACNNLY